MFKIKNLILPLIFFSTLICSILLESFLSFDIKSFFYTISLAIKECLIFILPLIIFSLIFNVVYELGSRAIKYIFLIGILVCLSNFVNVILSYATSSLFLRDKLICNLQMVDASSLTPLTKLFELNFPKFISNGFALVSGVVLGLLCSYVKRDFPINFSKYLEKFTKYFFKILIPIMPLFLIGTAIKLQYEGMLATICTRYYSILIIFLITVCNVIIIQYLVLAEFKINKFLSYLKNMIPAVITGFGAMSSAAALPLSIKAAEENLGNQKNARIIVPSVVNIHLIGDCFFIPMLALTIMVSFGNIFPGFSTYIIFSLYFILARFAVASVPGGGVLVMLPILQNYLGFNTDMLGLITAIYLLFDPIITACNIAGNGAIAIIFDKIVKSIKSLSH